MLAALGPVIAVLAAIFSVLTWPLRVVGHFLADWFGTRNWMWLVVAAPALFVAIAITAAAVRARWGSDEVLAASYSQRARIAFRATELERSEMLYRKAIKYRKSDNSLKYARAYILNQLDDIAGAARLMREIAPTEGDPGYLSAHMWLARGILLKELPVEGNRLRAAESHLNQILVQNSDHVEAHRLLADIALSVRNGSKAIDHVRYIVDEYPDTRIVLARLLHAASKKAAEIKDPTAEKLLEEARVQADQSKRYYAVKVQQAVVDDEDPENRPQSGDWLNYASAFVLLEQYDSAHNVLAAGIRRCEKKKPLRIALANLFILRNDLAAKENQGVEVRLRFLEQALRAAPDSGPALYRIAELIGNGKKSDAMAGELLKESLANGTAPGTVHFLLGTKAAEMGDDNQAFFHLEKANELLPNTPVILNNLAWILATKSETDRLDDALSLVNQAITLMPHQPHFHETRGQIHVRMRSWDKAIPDLERALRKLKGSALIHRGLALAYKNLGKEDMSDFHEQKIIKLTGRP